MQHLVDQPRRRQQAQRTVRLIFVRLSPREAADDGKRRRRHPARRLDDHRHNLGLLVDDAVVVVPLLGLDPALARPVVERPLALPPTLRTPRCTTARFSEGASASRALRAGRATTTTANSPTSLTYCITSRPRSECS